VVEQDIIALMLNCSTQLIITLITLIVACSISS